MRRNGVIGGWLSYIGSSWSVRSDGQNALYALLEAPDKPIESFLVRTRACRQNAFVARCATLRNAER